jgi:hypothetical protein
MKFKKAVFFEYFFRFIKVSLGKGNCVKFGDFCGDFCGDFYGDFCGDFSAVQETLMDFDCSEIQNFFR